MTEMADGVVTPDLAALRRELDEALLGARQGDYFRERVRGWSALRSTSNHAFDCEVVARLGVAYEDTRPEQPSALATLDAFVLAYHAAEVFVRHFIALILGAPPTSAPLIALAGTRTGPEFKDKVRAMVALDTKKMRECIDFIFLADIQAGDHPGLAEKSAHFCDEWVRYLASYILEYDRPYNAAKHGLAVVSTQASVSFVSQELDAEPISLIEGDILRTLETEPLRDVHGKRLRDSSGKPRFTASWATHSIDAIQLVAQTVIVSALLDWMAAVYRGKVTQQPTEVTVCWAPLPVDLRQANSPPGTRLRLPIGAPRLPPEQAQAIARRLAPFPRPKTEPPGPGVVP